MVYCRIAECGDKGRAHVTLVCIFLDFQVGCERSRDRYFLKFPHVKFIVGIVMEVTRTYICRRRIDDRTKRGLEAEQRCSDGPIVRVPRGCNLSIRSELAQKLNQI